MLRNSEIPVIDLFAGPGGLCEGFSSIFDETGARRFAVKVSIEKDPVAHRTLMLRAIFRKFAKSQVPDCYYEYLRGSITREQFLAHPDIKDAAEHAAKEAKCAELGLTPHAEIDAWISEALGDKTDWVLIGGPPCQAYSLAGRSRLSGMDREAFESDKRHFLYTEYLRIIQRFEPSVFVMENVKGMLNSTHGGTRIFERILADLKEPKRGLSYEVRSLVVDGDELEPKDYVIQAENYGIPQNRHRVILFGIRSDVAEATSALKASPRYFLLRKSFPKIGVEAALAGLPAIRSRLSKEDDSHKKWLSALRKAPSTLLTWHMPVREKIEALMKSAAKNAKDHESAGAKFTAMKVDPGEKMPKPLRAWLLDERVGGVVQHESRSHMRSDLHRYMFASCFSKSEKYAPTLRNFPPRLLPDHLNVDADKRASIANSRICHARAFIQIAGLAISPGN